MDGSPGLLDLEAGTITLTVSDAARFEASLDSPRVAELIDGATGGAAGDAVTVRLPDTLAVSNVEGVGFALIDGHPMALELAGVILLMAMLGAVVLARKQVELTEQEKAAQARTLGQDRGRAGVRRGGGRRVTHALSVIAADVASVGPSIGGPITMFHYLFVSAALFALGVIGFLTRRNMIIMFLCTEMMFQAAGIALIAFSKFHFNPDGRSVRHLRAHDRRCRGRPRARARRASVQERKETLDASAWAMLKG